MKTIAKKIIVATIMGSFLLTQSGCLTRELYRDSGITYEQRTTDTISTFLTDGNYRNLIIIGEKFHYWFAVNEQQKPLLSILNWKNKHLIRTKFNEFTITNTQNVEGSYTFELNPETMAQATNEDLLFLLDLGFSKNNSDRRLALTMSISGTRYTAKPLALNQQSRLNRPYDIVFKETVNRSSALEDLGRLVVTPVAIAADGALFIAAAAGSIVLAPIKTLIDFYK
jgi:hypothetical protein